MIGTLRVKKCCCQVTVPGDLVLLVSAAIIPFLSEVFVVRSGVVAVAAAVQGGLLKQVAY